ncbi:MAG: hypothetical protein OEY94_10810, partial [Alphaproteobacteria bacterium]|nr:hypothetical protein [Alphaproteobacteria bacterium]
MIAGFLSRVSGVTDCPWHMQERIKPSQAILHAAEGKIGAHPRRLPLLPLNKPQSPLRTYLPILNYVTQHLWPLAMTEQRFEQLIRELEGYAKAHPAQYKLKVALLAFTGYAYLLAVLGTVIALTIGCFFLITEGTSGRALLLKAGLGLIILATVIIRALWVRLEPPTGIEVQ